MAVQHAIGHDQAARNTATQWLARYPTSYFLREELGQPDNAHLGADIDRILNASAEYMRLGLFEKALGVLARDYPAVSADQREPGEAAAQNHPLVAYYRGYCKQKLGRSPDADFADAAKLSTRYVFPSGPMTYKVLQSALHANPGDANANFLLGTLEFSVGLTDAGMQKWQRALALNPQIPALDADIGRALLHLKADPEGALAAFKRGAAISDPRNAENYFGLDQTLSLLKRPATERAAALGQFPDKEKMPTALVYELALSQAEAGQFDSATSLFRNRSFLRAEGGTNVRQVWIEVGLLHAISLGRAGDCAPALELASHLGDAVPGLEFTRDGLQPVLNSARASYLLGHLNAGCGNADRAKALFLHAAAATAPEQMAWASKAARKTATYDQAKWRASLLSAIAVEENEGTALGACNAAMMQLELGNHAAAEAGFRQALTMPDAQMAYHLSRLALAGEDQ